MTQMFVDTFEQQNMYMNRQFTFPVLFVKK